MDLRMAARVLATPYMIVALAAHYDLDLVNDVTATTAGVVMAVHLHLIRYANGFGT